MENNWEPRVGQKVVALVSGSSIKKGNTYEVLATERCKCGTVHVYLNDRALPAGTITNCMDCNADFTPPVLFNSLRSFRVAPLPDQYADMTAEIAKQFKEHPDTVDQPVKVLETVN